MGEVKHCRVAMLAAVAWPTQEWLHPLLCDVMHMQNVNDANGFAPSIFNGGLAQPGVVAALVSGFALGASVEATDIWKRQTRGLKFNEWHNESIAGDVNFDPLQIAQDLFVTQRFELQEAEMINGRLAMFAIVFYAFVEYVLGMPIGAFSSKVSGL